MDGLAHGGHDKAQETANRNKKNDEMSGPESHPGDAPSCPSDSGEEGIPTTQGGGRGMNKTSEDNVSQMIILESAREESNQTNSKTQNTILDALLKEGEPTIQMDEDDEA